VPPFEDHVYLEWFPRSILSPIGKHVVSHFPRTEEEALQTTLRYDLIYSKSSYVYTSIPDLPHLGSANTLGASHVIDVSLDLFHTLCHILNKVMATCRGVLVPPTLMPLLLATCFHGPNPSTKLLLLLMHSLMLHCISIAASHASLAPASTFPLGSSFFTAECDQSQKFEEKH